MDTALPAEFSFLVASASGFTGTRVVHLLLERGHAVRAFVHRVDQRSEALANAGAEIAVGDLLRLEDVSSAMEGVGSAYFVYPIAPGLMDATATFAQAAAENKIRAIVNMSQISARRYSESNAAQQHWIAERILDWGPTPVTHMRPTFFAEWLVKHGRSVAQENVLRLPLEEGRHAPIAAEDQAHVITATLEDPEPHAGKVYELFGPEEFNHYEIAEIFSRVLGRTVEYEPISVETFEQNLTKAGRSPHLVQHLCAVAVDYRKGLFSGTNDVVERIGKKSGTTLESFIEQNRALFTA
jgi:NAD(P)H dehydrogenase (quinone)